MKQYIETVVCVLLCVGLCSHILPENGDGKCARFAAGLLVLYAVCSPLLHMNRLGIQIVPFSEQTLACTETDYVADTFEELLAERVTEKLTAEQLGEFAVKTEAEIKSGQVTGVATVRISPYKQNAAACISEYLGIEEEKVVELCRN